MRTAPLEMVPTSALAREPRERARAATVAAAQATPSASSTTDQDGPAELLRSRLAPALCGLYRVLGGGRRPVVARAAFAALARLEGGITRSSSVRTLLRNDFGITVGAYSHGPGLRPGALPPGVIVGRYTTIGGDVRVVPADLGGDQISTHPMFRADRPGGDGGAGLSARRAVHGSSRLVIGHDVWIGTGVVIADTCVRIGNGAIVADGSTVTEDVPPFAIVAGSPARVVRERFVPEVTRLVGASRWWDHGAAEAAEVLASLRQTAAEAWPARQPVGQA